MYKIFDTLEQYNQFTDNGTHLTAGILYIVKENKSLYFLTNNIDGEAEKYEYLDEIPEGYIIPTGNIEITENGENINVNDYATASVNVPIPEGYIKPTGNKTITQNGTNINVNDYATATVNVTPNLTTQNITENGTYQPSGNYDGFSSVTVNVPQPTGNISITENGENIDIAQYATATVNVAGSAKDYIVEGAVYDPTETYSGAFDPKTQIVTANIPSGFTSIGNDAFRQCSVLTSITIPNGVTSIGSSAFQVCTGLTSITIPDSVTSIGQGAFVGCTGLTSITIPDSVTSIGQGAFQTCSGLTSIVVDSANTVYDSRDNCNAIIKTSTNELITGCKNTIIPNSVTSIGQQAFFNCTGLASIIIPDSVTSIGEAVFYYCTKLTSVTIGSGVTSIGSSTFNACPDITSVTIQATTPPTLGSTVFGFYNYPIYVPAESLEAYKAATNWSSLADRIQAIPTD